MWTADKKSTGRNPVPGSRRGTVLFLFRIFHLPRRSRNHSRYGPVAKSSAEGRLAKSTLTRIFYTAVSLAFFLTGIVAMAQGNTPLRDSRIIDPILTEESLPEDAGECNLRTTAAYHAAAPEPMAVLPRTQVFCGFSRRWGGEIDVPLVRIGGLYGPGDVGAAVKYKYVKKHRICPR
jgi:hypothetical protein